MIRIVVADDHPVVRQGLITLLESEQNFKVVGECADGLSVLATVQNLMPDALLLDLMMPGLNGTEVCRRIKASYPSVRVIILSMHSDEAYVLETIKNGANGYVTKDDNLNCLIEAINNTQNGSVYLCPILKERFGDMDLSNLRESATDNYNSLTLREKEVLQLLVDGKNTNAIAELLGISPRTVEIHRSNLKRKLGIHNQTELIRYAIGRGLIQASA